MRTINQEENDSKGGLGIVEQVVLSDLVKAKETGNKDDKHRLLNNPENARVLYLGNASADFVSYRGALVEES